MNPSRRVHLPLLVAATFLMACLAGVLLAKRIGVVDAAPPDDKSGVHLPQTQRINFNYNMQDGEGYPWDIQYYGTVGQGKNYVYNSGLYCMVGGNNVNSNGQGWSNADGTEIELGPYSYNGMKVYRRIRVYKDQPLARWMDIFENPGSTDLSFQVQIQTNTNGVNGKTVGSSGKNGFGEKDWAFATDTPNTGNNSPALLHIVCGKNSKVRPTVQVQGSSISVRYDMKVKAGQTAILTYFESQGNSIEDHMKALKKFQAYKALRDLPAGVRKLIVNFPASTATYEDFNLERSEQGDQVMLANGDPLLGQIKNESFSIDSSILGKTTLKAADVIGMMAAPAEPGIFRVLLKDGQMLRGTITDAELQVKREGSDLKVPFEKVTQWSFKISPEHPFDLGDPGPVLVLRTGDRLAFDAKATELRLRTRYGLVSLKAADLQAIKMDNGGNAIHRVIFANGSTLGGMIEPTAFDTPLKLGGKTGIARNLVSEVVYLAEEKSNPILSHVTLSNGDELQGDLADEKITLQTPHGLVELKPDAIKTITAAQTPQAATVVELWDGTILRGQLTQEEFTYELMPGPKLKIPTSQITNLVRAQVLAPQETIKKVDQLVALLGAEAIKDRTKAVNDLVAMGPTIVPLLQRGLNSHDPEIRQRIQLVIDRISGKRIDEPPAVDPSIMIND